MILCQILPLVALIELLQGTVLMISFWMMFLSSLASRSWKELLHRGRAHQQGTISFPHPLFILNVDTSLLWTQPQPRHSAAAGRQADGACALGEPSAWHKRQKLNIQSFSHRYGKSFEDMAY